MSQAEIGSNQFYRGIHSLGFQLAGGWPAVFWKLVFKAIGYFSIGFLVHLGWNLV